MFDCRLNLVIGKEFVVISEGDENGLVVWIYLWRQRKLPHCQVIARALCYVLIDEIFSKVRNLFYCDWGILYG